MLPKALVAGAVVAAGLVVIRRKPRVGPPPFYAAVEATGQFLYRLHPAIGARPVEPEELRFLVPLTEADEPESWRSRWEDEDEEALAWENWARAVMSAVAALGTSRIYVETSDQHGLDALRALPGVTPTEVAVRFECEPHPDVIDAVTRTNVSRLVQTVNDEPYLTVIDAWSGMFLNVAEPTILARFSTPWESDASD